MLDSKYIKQTSQMAILTICMLTLLALTGCKEESDMRVDPDFSVNLIIVEKSFPSKKLKKSLTAAQLEAIEKLGAPNFLRVWWDTRGAIKYQTELIRSISKKDYYQKPKTWLYESEGIEVYFDDKDNFRTAPIQPKISVLMKHGDPENVVVRQLNDEYRERWQYFSAGVIYTFNDKGEFAEPPRLFQGTGSYIKH